MANKVYVNGREVACKAAKGKSVAAFPDVCLSPPSPPAGPVPIPYPNTAFAKDTANGSKTVKISGKEVMLKDKSYFKKSTGDEAATKTLGMGVVSHQITGKVHFTSWSMNVKIEGKNAVRHLDLTTHNHLSAMPGNTPPWPYLDSMAVALDHPCVDDAKKEFDSCKEYSPYTRKSPCPEGGKPTAESVKEYAIEIEKKACLRSRRCMLQPYENTETGKGGCCDGQTGHHLVEASAFHVKGRGAGAADFETGENVKLQGCNGYDMRKAPCICVEGTNHGVGTHGLMHKFQSGRAILCMDGRLLDAAGKPTETVKVTTLEEAQKSGVQAVKQTFPLSGCNEACIEAQLKSYHEGEKSRGGLGMDPKQPIKAVHTCKPDTNAITEAQNQVAERGRQVLGAKEIARRGR
jgi:hypothetical protein